MSDEADHTTLARLAAFLRTRAAVAEKVAIRRAYAPAQPLAGTVRVGDDCAAIPDPAGGGYLLFAAEGMLASFVARDPWFAGYSAVMVNLSDVAAMGGSPLAVVDILWTPGHGCSAAIWDGLAAASRAYGVPVVGGHTTLTGDGGSDDGPTFLAAAVLGRAQTLLTSFDARPGDDLLLAVDLRGAYRGDQPFWNASTDAPAERLREDLALLPELAARGWCAVAKDVSNGGVVGTLAMLLECSGVGAELWLDRLPRPPGADLARWLVSFPSFGFLLSVPPERSAAVNGLFVERGIACAVVGRVTTGPTACVVLGWGAVRETFSLAGVESPSLAPPSS